MRVNKMPIRRMTMMQLVRAEESPRQAMVDGEESEVLESRRKVTQDSCVWLIPISSASVFIVDLRGQRLINSFNSHPLYRCYIPAHSNDSASPFSVTQEPSRRFAGFEPPCHWVALGTRKSGRSHRLHSITIITTSSCPCEFHFL